MAENQKLVPVLRFKDEQGSDYPDWEGKLLGEISRFSKGKGISKTDVKENGTVKCIRYGELYTRYGETISNVISSTNVPVSELVLSHKNDVIIPASGETALDIASAACITVEGVALGGDINIIRCQQNGIFLAYYLISKKKDIARLAQGISIVHLYSAQLTSLNLRIPSKQEQQKIANSLSSVDTKIEQLGKKKALLEQYKKGMMQKLFSQEIRFKDEQGNDYPDWEEMRFDEIANITMGTSPKSSAYNHSMNGLPLIQGNADVKNRKSAPRIYTSEITKECLPNDTLLSVRAPVGEVSRAIHHACIGRGISAVRVKAISVQDYIFHYLVWSEPKWKGLSQGSTFESVNTKSIESLKILVPSKLEQQKIADFLSAIDKKIDLVAEQLEQARTFKKGLLQQMFI